MNNSKIAFIGAGNMANSLIRGLLAKGVTPAHIAASDIDPAKLSALAEECGIRTGTAEVVAGDADVLVLAVKPQVMEQVCATLRPLLPPKGTLLISIAAGIPLRSLEAWLGGQQAIVRCMPNTPALVAQGATGLFANAYTSDEQAALAGDILAAVGISCWLDSEEDINAVTALSGSGPAYFFLLMEAMEQAALGMGLNAELARQLTLQTALGAATLAINSDVAPDELRRRVTSPGGTTEAAIRQFESEDLRGIVERALRAAQKRSVELAG
ncbi:MAG: pyrroline-5-carboxylate reductase [Pseudomonadales bacterium]|nr:pyrroline-5-carboxylate reductase [Pseudomonadales bacterium]MCP5330342.1 pyrroline-5-carboxylate reductase [Pseudomonadales bacterium]MCP5344045.1 pyrroline-5-carboxylate reductase [Pseudomonadales bacterium]